MCVYRPNVQPLFPWVRGAPTECTTACGAASGGGSPGDVKCEYEGGDDVSFQSCDESSKPAPRTCPNPPPCGTSTPIAGAECEGLEWAEYGGDKINQYITLFCCCFMSNGCASDLLLAVQVYAMATNKF